MAYQPIEMSNRPPMYEAMESFRQSLRGLAEQNHQQDLEEKARKRQDFADFQSSYLQAKQLADKGDHAGAAAIMARWKGHLGGSPTALATPSMQTQAPGAMPQGQPPGAPPPQGGSPMPDQMEFKPPMQGGAPMAGGAPPMPREEGPDGVGPDGRPVGPPPTAGQALMGAAQRPPAPDDHPMVAAAQGSKARDQARNNVLFFTPPGGGQETSYDPQAVREQQQAEKTARLDALIKTANPETRKLYEELRPAIIASDSPLDVTDIVKVISAKASSDQAAAMFSYRQDHDSQIADDKRTALETRDATARRGQGMALQGNLAKAAAMGPGNPLKVDTNNRADTGKLESTLKDFVSMADGKSLIRSNRALRSAITNISAKGPDAVTAHKDAFLQLERQFKGGGTPTEGEAVLLLHHLGGIPGAMQQFVADAETGDFSDITKQNLARAAQLAKGELEQNMNDLMGGLAEVVGPGTEFEGMGSNVNRKIKGIGKIYGLDLPDLYQGEAGRKQVVLGSGERSPAAKPAAPAHRPGRPAHAPGGAKSNDEYLRLYLEGK